MPWIGVLLGTMVLLGSGGHAALPDEEPAYLGDMPSVGDCATGELLQPLPELPVDPCSVGVPLPTGCPVVPRA